MKGSTISVKLNFSLTLLTQAPQCDFFSFTWTPGNQDGKQACNTVAMSVPHSLASPLWAQCPLISVWPDSSSASSLRWRKKLHQAPGSLSTALPMVTPVQHKGGPLSHLQLSPGSRSHMLSVIQVSFSSIGTILVYLVLPHKVPLLNLNSVSSESLVFFSVYYQQCMLYIYSSSFLKILYLQVDIRYPWSYMFILTSIHQISSKSCVMCRQQNSLSQSWFAKAVIK